MLKKVQFIFNIFSFVYRDSVDNLNYKFEDGCSIQTTNSQFQINLDELNKEFIPFDSEFNVNNWADLQLEEVRSHII